MLEFVDRLLEQERLHKALGRKTPVFVVLYGWRRCGKSRLVRQALRAGDCYFMADQSESAQ